MARKAGRTEEVYPSGNGQRVTSDGSVEFNPIDGPGPNDNYINARRTLKLVEAGAFPGVSTDTIELEDSVEEEIYIVKAHRAKVDDDGNIEVDDAGKVVSEVVETEVRESQVAEYERVFALNEGANN